MGVLQDLIDLKIFEWIAMFSAISGICRGIYKGIKDDSIIKGVRSAFLGFLVISAFGGFYIVLGTGGHWIAAPWHTTIDRGHLIAEKVSEWMAIFSFYLGIISGIGYGIYEGIKKGSILKGIGFAFLGFFVICIVGGIAALMLPKLAIAGIAPVVIMWWAFLNPKDVANSLPFGWFFVSIGYAMSVFIAIQICRDQETARKYKALKMLLIVPLSYIAFEAVMITAGVITRAIINSLPFGWFFVSTGCAISILIDIWLSRRQKKYSNIKIVGEREINSKYQAIIEYMFMIPFFYITFGTIVIIVPMIIHIATTITKAVANSLPF